MADTSYSKTLAVSLRDNPKGQLELLKEAIEKQWETPEVIQKALNTVAKAQGRNETLDSCDFFAIVQFIPRLGFKLVVKKDEASA